MTTRKAPTSCSMGRCLSRRKSVPTAHFFPRPNDAAYMPAVVPRAPRAAVKRGFHLSAEAAEASGFRACSAAVRGGVPQSERDAALIARAALGLQVGRAASAPTLPGPPRPVSARSIFSPFPKPTGLTPKASRTRTGRSMRKRCPPPPRRRPLPAAIFYDAGFTSNGRF